MGIAEIIILLVGAVLFTVSFIIPEKGGAGAVLDEEEERKIIRKLLDEEMSGFKYQIEEATQEVLDENRDKMERAMDRITNEKMSAVNEYSDTVMEQIHKNHDEAMFLYDMLNNKHSQVKNTAAELNQITKSAKVAGEAVKTIKSNVESVPTPVMTTMPSKVEETKTSDSRENDEIVESLKTFENIEIPSVAVTDEKVVESELAVDEKAVESAPVAEETAAVAEADAAEWDAVIDTPVVEEEKKTTKKKKAKVEKKEPVADAGLDLLFATDNNSANNNDRILELHKAGKSNMAIAKELGLGIGEVKLVLDLFGV